MGMVCEHLEQGVNEPFDQFCRRASYLHAAVRITLEQRRVGEFYESTRPEKCARLLAALVQPRSRVALSGASLPVSPVYESGSLMYLNTQRPKLLGELSSHELLEADNRNGVLSPTLVRNTSVQQFVFVDEPSCIGCRARSRRSSSATLCHAVVRQPHCAMSSDTRALRDLVTTARQATAPSWPAALSGWKMTSVWHGSSSRQPTRLRSALERR